MAVPAIEKQLEMIEWSLQYNTEKTTEELKSQTLQTGISIKGETEFKCPNLNLDFTRGLD